VGHSHLESNLFLQGQFAAAVVVAETATVGVVVGADAEDGIVEYLRVVEVVSEHSVLVQLVR
jgi:hypothetical protein